MILPDHGGLHLPRPSPGGARCSGLSRPASTGSTRSCARALGGIRVIRAFARTDYEEKRFAQANQELTDTTVSVFRLFALVFPIAVPHHEPVDRGHHVVRRPAGGQRRHADRESLRLHRLRHADPVRRPDVHHACRDDPPRRRMRAAAYRKCWTSTRRSTILGWRRAHAGERRRQARTRGVQGRRVPVSRRSGRHPQPHLVHRPSGRDHRDRGQHGERQVHSDRAHPASERRHCAAAS